MTFAFWILRCATVLRLQRSSPYWRQFAFGYWQARLDCSCHTLWPKSSYVCKSTSEAATNCCCCCYCAALSCSGWRARIAARFAASSRFPSSRVLPFCAAKSKTGQLEWTLESRACTLSWKTCTKLDWCSCSTLQAFVVVVVVVRSQAEWQKELIS